jgi:hypothetical protein
MRSGRLWWKTNIARCRNQKPSLRDYQGAICTGNPIEVTPISQPPQRFGIDYPGANEVTAPTADRTTIVLDLKLMKADSETSDSSETTD